MSNDNPSRLPAKVRIGSGRARVENVAEAANTVRNIGIFRLFISSHLTSDGGLNLSYSPCRPRQGGESLRLSDSVDGATI
jgi:hypothetical protein